MAFLDLVSRVGLRARFIVFLALAFTPIIVLLVSTNLANYGAALDAATRDVKQMAEYFATRQSAAFHQARTILNTVRSMPPVSVLGGAECNRAMAAVAETNPQFYTVGVVDRDQMIVCHNTLTKPQRFGNVEMIERMTRPDAPEFNVGEFFVGKVSGKPTVIVSMKLPAIDGVAPGAVFAGMNLTNLSLLAGQGMPEGRTAAIFQMPAGKLLARHPPMESLLGSVVPIHPVLDTLRNSRSFEAGFGEGLGLDGREMLFGFAPLNGIGEAMIVAIVGIPRSDVVAPLNRSALWSFTICLAVIVATFAGTWWIGYWTQLRPIGRLRRTAHRIASGDLGARATIETWQAPELRALGDDFDAMTERLEEGRKAEEEVARSEARYRILAENTSDLVTSLDDTGRRVFVSPACRELLGREPDELMAGRPEDIAHPDDLPIVGP